MDFAPPKYEVSRKRTTKAENVHGPTKGPQRKAPPPAQQMLELHFEDFEVNICTVTSSEFAAAAHGLAAPPIRHPA